METIKHIHLPETTSTNDFLRRYEGEEGALLTCVSTDFQTAGRGQGTNRWESERGCNLTFSVLCRPVGLPPLRQFALLEACSLALRDVLSRRAEGFSVKWPNDIYWHDRKISGTLIETSLAAGRIKDCIVGVGVNVNQTEFLSDAPNPVSLAQILSRETDRMTLLRDIVTRFEGYLSAMRDGRYEQVVTPYMSYLYRSGGFHTYRDTADGSEFEAAIVEVEDDGHLILRDRDGRVRSYAFKEVAFA